MYAGRVGDVFRLDDRSYLALSEAGVDWQSALQVLRASPRVRHHIGAVLRVAARTDDGRWIAVVSIEEADDEYLVVAARELDENEVVAVKTMMDGGT